VIFYVPRWLPKVLALFADFADRIERKAGQWRICMSLQNIRAKHSHAKYSRWTMGI
jgi:hypothetical protein